jgi:hypothetical protein
MTQQVRTGYRNHRKAAWGLALLLVAAIAAVTIPFASGAPTKTLVFDKQPANPWQKDTPITPTASAIAVKVINGTQGGTPTIAATGAGTTLNFDFGSPVNNNGTWSWPNAKPKADAPSGLYNLVVTLGSLTATSDSDLSPSAPGNQPFRVADYVCVPESPTSCNDLTSHLNTGAQGKLSIANTLGSPIALDFQLGLDPVPLGCNNATPGQTWNRTYFGDPPVYFPAVALDFTEHEKDMLQVTYAIRNSEWVLTNAARGNQDIEFCAVARHQTARWNGDGAEPRPFSGKYGPAQWDGTNYSGVLTTVSNPSKVKTDGTGSPAVCGRGTQDISGETWRTWTVCIPWDLDYKMG